MVHVRTALVASVLMFALVSRSRYDVFSKLFPVRGVFGASTRIPVVWHRGVSFYLRSTRIYGSNYSLERRTEFAQRSPGSPPQASQATRPGDG